MYSAKNTITKSTDLYSVLNPLTNSLSPSAKSKGDRLASARTLTLNIRKVIRLHDMADTCFSWPMSHKVDIPPKDLENLENLANSDFHANLGKIIHDIYLTGHNLFRDMPQGDHKKRA